MVAPVVVPKQAMRFRRNQSLDGGLTGPMAVLRPALAIVLLLIGVSRADVVTSLSGTHLFVTGDDTADSILITPSEGAASVTVTGFDGTLVDGADEAVSFPNVRRLTVKLMHGADRLAIAWITLPGPLYVGMGKGNDDVDLEEVVAGAVTIATSQGYDIVNVFGPSYFDSLDIRTGSGDDVVNVEAVAVDWDLDVVAGRDEDDVSIVGVDVYDDVDVHLSSGDDLMWFGDAFVGDDTKLDGDSGDNWLDLFGYLDLWEDVDIDGFGDDDWWWWY